MFRYRLHSPDGDDLGEATYAVMIKPGEEIIAGSNERDDASFGEPRPTRQGVLSVTRCASSAPKSTAVIAC